MALLFNSIITSTHLHIFDGLYLIHSNLLFCAPCEFKCCIHNLTLVIYGMNLFLVVWLQKECLICCCCILVFLWLSFLFFFFFVVFVVWLQKECLICFCVAVFLLLVITFFCWICCFLTEMMSDFILCCCSYNKFFLFALCC